MSALMCSVNRLGARSSPLACSRERAPGAIRTTSISGRFSVFGAHVAKSCAPVPTLRLPQTHRTVVHSSSKDGKETSDVAKVEADKRNTLFTVGIAILALGLYGYAFFLSPNQTPYRDKIFIERLVGLGDKDGFTVTPVFQAVFNLMGVYPALYASILIPGARSESKLPAWPFVSASFAFGVFALLPYMVLWQPEEDAPALPLPKEELEGWNKLFMKSAETPYLPGFLLAAASYQIYLMITAGTPAWVEYAHLLDESRFVHVTSLDFLTLTALMPFWMINDATRRNWEYKETAVPVLSLIPLIGPAIYLLLRPKTDFSK